MELFAALSARIASVAALLGARGRDAHDRAVDAAREGDLEAFRRAMDALERDIARTRWAA